MSSKPGAGQSGAALLIDTHWLGGRRHWGGRWPHTTLEDQPEAFDRLGVDRTDDVLALGMVNGRVRIFLVEFLVTHEAAN